VLRLGHRRSGTTTTAVEIDGGNASCGTSATLQAMYASELNALLKGKRSKVDTVYLLYSMLYYCDYFVTFLVGGLGERALVFLVSF